MYIPKKSDTKKFIHIVNFDVVYEDLDGVGIFEWEYTDDFLMLEKKVKLMNEMGTDIDPEFDAKVKKLNSCLYAMDMRAKLNTPRMIHKIYINDNKLDDETLINLIKSGV